MGYHASGLGRDWGDLAGTFFLSTSSSKEEVRLQPQLQMKAQEEEGERALGFSEAYPTYELRGMDKEVLKDISVPEPSLGLREDVVSQSTKAKEAESVIQSESESPEKEQEQPPAKPQEEEISDEKEAIFVDQEEYDKALLIQVLPESSRLKYRSIVLEHERHYRNHPTRLYVPRLKSSVKLSLKEFAVRFLLTSQPVIVPYEAMRHLGFNSRSFTIDELLELYPNRQPMVYKYGGIGSAELDLGPAIAALQNDQDLKKTSKGRNYPRNTKIGNIKAISKLTVQEPPYILPDTKFMPPSLWFGSTSTSTKFHSDCCDNYAMMVMGTKIWTLAPPSEARILHPKCAGGLCWVNSIEHPDEHANTPSTIALRDKLQRITFELHAGEMLYLPCGWFHHVENKDPTIMVNWWTKTKAMFLVSKEEERTKMITSLT